MTKRDYYEVLGLARTAGEQDLKSAFRRLAKDHHPDRNPGDKDAEQKFREASEAYEVLKDPQKRAAYDQYGHAAFEQGGRGGQAGFGPDFAASMFEPWDRAILGQQTYSARSAGHWVKVKSCRKFWLDDPLSPRVYTPPPRLSGWRAPKASKCRLRKRCLPLSRAASALTR